jgi:uncharacterized protein
MRTSGLGNVNSGYLRPLAAGMLHLVMTLAAVPATAQSAAPAVAPRTISVSGQGEVRAEPDRALVTLGVEARSPRMETARGEVTKGINAILQLARDLGIDSNLVHATRVNIQPEYNWDNQSRERTLIGYLVSRQVQVELRNLDQLSTLIERAVDAGVNQVSDPQLDSSRKSELEREALAKAVEDARMNAEVIARAAGVRLGTARNISAQSVAAPQPVAYRMAAMAEAAPAAQAGYQSGEMTFTATVQVEFDLNAPQ